MLTPGPEAALEIGLKVESARMISIDQVLTLEGAVDLPPARRGFAASQFSGTIQSIHVDRGQAVAKGELMAEIFSPELLTMQQELLRAAS